MIDELTGSLGQTLNDFLASQEVAIAVNVVIIYIVLVWLASAFWAYRDMRQRTTSALAPYVAAGVIILFTPIFFLFGLLLYRIIRPKETIGEANERMLTEEAILAEVQSRPHCANCMRPVHDEWIICPTCRNRLRRVCPNCEHLVELDWSLCAWCGRDFERAEAPGTAYMPRARQPVPAVPVGTQPQPQGATRPPSPRPPYSRPAQSPANAAQATTPPATAPTGTSPTPRPSTQTAQGSTSAQPRPATGER
jgi:hypothetical protein